MSVLAEGGDTLRTDYHTILYANRFAFPRGLSSYGQVDCYYVTNDTENVIDNDYNIDLPILCSISQVNTGEDSSLENKIWEDKIASPRIYDDDSSSIETVLDPRLYQETLIEGLQKGYNTQDTLMLEDNKSNSDEQENFSMGGSYFPFVDYLIELLHPLIIRDQDQSDSSYNDPEELEHGSSL